MLPLWPSIFLPESASLGTFVLVRARSNNGKDILLTFGWGEVHFHSEMISMLLFFCCLTCERERDRHTERDRYWDQWSISSKEHTDCTQTHDCTPSHNSNRFIKFAMTRLWWVSSATEMRQTTGARWAAWPGGAVTQSLSECGEDEGDCCWLQESALSACSSDHQWCDRGESEQHQFLGVHITEDLSWTNNTAALAKKAQQRLYFLRKLREPEPRPIMCTFYRGTIESILTSCITVWYGTCNVSCRKSLQRIVRAAEKIVGVLSPLPPGHLQHPSHPQSPQHCRWSHPPDTQLLQSATVCAGNIFVFATDLFRFFLV